MTSRACVLVTGSGGFVGRNLIPDLLGQNLEVIGVDGSAVNASDENLRTLRADVLEPGGLAAIDRALGERVAEELHTVHLVGLSHVGVCEAQPDLAHDVNVRSVQLICDLVARHGGRRFVLPSTALVYGSAADTVLTEEMPANPGSVYAATKCQAENYLINDELGESIEPIVLRLANLYGPGMHPDTLIPAIHSQLEAGELRLREYRSVRDYLYMADTIRAFVAAIFGLNHYPLYNVGTGHGASVLDVAEAIAKVMGRDDVLSRVPRPETFGPSLVLSPERIGRDLGWTAEYSVQRGVEDMFSTKPKG